MCLVFFPRRLELEVACMSMQQVKGTENEEKEERGRGEVCLEEKQCLDNSDTPAYTQLG